MGAIAAVLSRLLGFFSSGWLGIFGGLILATSLTFLGWLGWKTWRRWRYRRGLKKLPPMENLYQQMLNWLAIQGYRKHPAQTPLEYAEQAHETQERSRAQVIQDISQAYVNWRYGQQSPNISDLQRKLREIQKTKIPK
jgi:protein-glutamine gamma-glutamyltransferase